MNIQGRVGQFQREHQELEQIVRSLTQEQITKERIFEDWTTQDIIAHITAWTQKAVEELDDLDAHKQPWIVGVDVDTFNHKVVKELRTLSWKEIRRAWKNAWFTLIQRIRKVPEEQWNQETGFSWPDGASLTRASLFDYEYEGANHEGGHAKQIREHFGLKAIHSLS